MQDPNYVAKLRVNVLRAKGLKPLGHIFDFATLCMRLLPRMLNGEARSGIRMKRLGLRKPLVH